MGDYQRESLATTLATLVRLSWPENCEKYIGPTYFGYFNVVAKAWAVIKL